MRQISPEGLRQLLAQEAGHSFVMLLELAHADMDSPMRYCNNIEDVIYNGNTYVAYPFTPVLPSDIEDEIPEVTITIDNVGQALVNALRSIFSPLDVSLYVVRIDDNGNVTVEVGPMAFKLNQISYNAFTIDLAIGFEFDVLNGKAESTTFDPSVAPGLFT